MKALLVIQRFHPGFVVGLLWLLHLVHPFIHGTPLDSGALDSLLANVSPLGALYANEMRSCD